eukprot:CAMPEP_0180553572 /NCGR_PEP_ID=MMETSP1036_2-20121128/74444_1 /TAXON_ID=632150 /ORGANISM="Azadinium spinosum, Strain 3D9" /LENGTH=67 /DNA_ID=CAMNT_0022569289 /DNA_START=21 /DNA_END=220 /DNA_ORIENTATION=+
MPEMADALESRYVETQCPLRYTDVRCPRTARPHDPTVAADTATQDPQLWVSGTASRTCGNNVLQANA